jgi:hypothetical protein
MLILWSSTSIALLQNCCQGSMGLHSGVLTSVEQQSSAGVPWSLPERMQSCKHAAMTSASAERLWSAVQVLSTAQGRRFKASLFTLPRIWAQIQVRLLI